MLNSPLILELASHYEFVTSQVVLRWAIHLNVTVIPRSKNPRNIQLNLRALDLALKPDEVEMLTNISLYEYHPLERKYIKKEGNHTPRLAKRAAPQCIVLLGQPLLSGASMTVAFQYHDLGQ